jgi:hypothetical protein
MAPRQTDEKPQVSAEPNMYYNLTSGGVTGADLGFYFHTFEYRAVLNGGEVSRVVLHDPYLNILNDMMKQYLMKSRKDAPVNTNFRMGWALDDKYTPNWQHSMVSLEPTGGAPQSGMIEIVGVDNPSYMMTGGSADGARYKGNVKKVVEAVVKKYGRGIVTPDFKTTTKDSKENQWWQDRQDPKSFIMSLLEWAGPMTKSKTQWCVWPDLDKLIVVQQADDKSIPRAVYQYRSPTEKGSDALSDIHEWQLLGDNILQMYRYKTVSNGISSVSGAYYDKITDKPKEFSSDPSVYVGDINQTSRKFVPKNQAGRAYSKPGRKSPPDEVVGWTTIRSIPERNAGEMGLRYDKYIDGYARHHYLGLNNMLFRCRFRVTGHYIWMGSEGLGNDTIKIVMQNTDDGPYWLSGNWIVYGVHHVMTRSDWYTDLYCSKLDHDATGRKVGK